MEAMVDNNGNSQTHLEYIANAMTDLKKKIRHNEKMCKYVLVQNNFHFNHGVKTQCELMFKVGIKMTYRIAPVQFIAQRCEKYQKEFLF